MRIGFCFPFYPVLWSEKGNDIRSLSGLQSTIVYWVMEITIVYWGYNWDNGKENGNYYNGFRRK